jgi:hypothetical protein
MAIDKRLINRKITLIAQDLKRLKPLAQLNFQKYQAKYENEIFG